MNVLLPYWRGVPERCFYQEIQSGIVAALVEFGHQAFRFPFQKRAPVEREEAALLVRLFTQARIDIVLDLACWGFGLSRLSLPAVNGPSEAVFDRFGIAYVAWLFDQPCNQQISGVTAGKHYALYPDLGHQQQMRLIYPSVRLSGEAFAPPAVRLENDVTASDWTASRPIDVLYIGNLETQAIERRWRTMPQAELPPFFEPGFCECLADRMLSDPDRPLHLCLQEVMTSFGKTAPAFNVRFHVSLVEHFLRHLYRQRAVSALAQTGVRMQVVGAGWDALGLPSTVAITEVTDYDGIFRLAAQAKVCLDASTYLDGVNDRVFSYAINKSVCFTNANGYLRDVPDGSAGLRFQEKQRLLRDLGEQAAQTVRSAHTWRHRIGTVLSAMRCSASDALLRRPRTSCAERPLEANTTPVAVCVRRSRRCREASELLNAANGGLV